MRESAQVRDISAAHGNDNSEFVTQFAGLVVAR